MRQARKYRGIDYDRIMFDLLQERVSVALHAYADESGTHDETGLQPGSEVAVVAGYIAEQDQWGAFVPEWRKALLDEGLETPFHASDMLGPRGLCLDPDWPQPRIDAFVRRLIQIARSHTYFAVTGLLVVSHYNDVVPEVLRKIYGHPYLFAFQLFLAKALGTINNDLEDPLPPGEEVAFLFDQQEEFGRAVLDVYDQYKARRDPHGRLGPTGQFSKEKYVPLQAADLLAYRMRKIQTRKLIGQPAINPGSWDSDLIESRNIISAVYDKEGLAKLVEFEMRERGL